MALPASRGCTAWFPLALVLTAQESGITILSCSNGIKKPQRQRYASRKG